MFNNFDKYNRILYLFVLYMNLIIEDAFNNNKYNFNVENNDYTN